MCVCTLKRGGGGGRDGRFGRWTRGSDDGCVSPLVAMKIGRKVKRG